MPAESLEERSGRLQLSVLLGQLTDRACAVDGVVEAFLLAVDGQVDVGVTVAAVDEHRVRRDDSDRRQ